MTSLKTTLREYSFYIKEDARVFVVLVGMLLTLLYIYSAFAGGTAILVQDGYAFYTDAGKLIGAHNTPLTDVRKGERMKVVISTYNNYYSGAGQPATSSYKLQWENYTDNPNTWNDLGTTTQIRYAYSLNTALAGHSGNIPDYHSATYDSGGNGRSVAGSGTSSPYISDGNFAFTIDTGSSTIGKMYRFRLATSTASGMKTLDTYFNYPTITIRGTATGSPRISKEARGGTTTTIITSDRMTSMFINTEGNPAIGMASFQPYMIICTAPDCTQDISSTTDNNMDALGYSNYGSATATMMYTTNGPSGRITVCDGVACPPDHVYYSSSPSGVTGKTDLVLGADGNPIFAVEDSGEIDLMHCLGYGECNFPLSALVAWDGVNSFTAPSLILGFDGAPMIAYVNSNGGVPYVQLTVCDFLCVAVTARNMVGASDIGNGAFVSPSLAMGWNGRPILAYQDQLSQTLRFTRCTTTNCSAIATSTLDANASTGWNPSLAVGIDGNPVIAYFNDSSGLMEFLHCSNPNCTASTIVDMASGLVPYSASSTAVLSIAPDGNPVIASYLGDAYGDTLFTKCNSIDCSSTGPTANMNNAADLRFLLDRTEYAAVSAEDNVYDLQYGSANTRIAYEATMPAVSSTSPIYVSWVGDAVGDSMDISLEIYNRSSKAWEQMATGSPGISLRLSGSKSTSFANYYSNQNEYTVRVITATTTAGTYLITDYFGFGMPISQNQYLFLNDDGTTAEYDTIVAGEATSTPLTGVHQGERLNVRIQLQGNSQDTAATSSLKLQYENYTSATGTWKDVGTTTEVRWALSQQDAVRSRWGSPILSTVYPGVAASSTCANPATHSENPLAYVSGYFTAGSATSVAQYLDAYTCTEMTYAIDTGSSTLANTYRLRLVDASSTPFEAYNAYPTFTIMSTALDIPRISKEARGGTTTIVLESANNVGRFPSLMIGSDGDPFIAHYDVTNGDLRGLHCSDGNCTATSGTLLEDANNVGLYPSVLQYSLYGLGSSPAIAHYDATNGDLRLFYCLNTVCTSTSSGIAEGNTNVGLNPSAARMFDGFHIADYDSTNGDLQYVASYNSQALPASSTLEAINNVGNGPSLTMDNYGNSLVSHYDATNGDLRLLRCIWYGGLNCTATSSLKLESINDVGSSSAIMIGVDSNPLIAHYDKTNGDLRLLRCTNGNCTATSGVALEAINNVGLNPSMAIGVNGNPVIAHYDATNGDLRLLLCLNSTCTATSGLMLEGTNNVGNNPSLAIGADGNPVIAHYDATNGDLLLTKCNSIDCNSTGVNANFRNAADLTYLLDDKGYINVGQSDGLYDSIGGSPNTRIAYLANVRHGNNSDSIYVGWEGKMTVATTVAMEIYDRSAGKWINLASNAAPTPNTNFTLTGATTTSLSSYYGAGNEVSVRVITGTTTLGTTLSTDKFVPFMTPVTLREYIFQNDDGTDANTNTPRGGVATSTPISLTRYAEGRILRMQIDNEGSLNATSTAAYTLQYAYANYPDQWYDLNAPFQYSKNGSMSASWGAAPLPSIQVTATCANGYTYVPGRLMDGFSSPAIVLGPNTCTELAFLTNAVSSSYRYRLVDASTSIPIQTTLYPSETFATTTDVLTVSRQEMGLWSMVIDSLAGAGRKVAMAVGNDGNPLIAYQDSTNKDLRLLRCLNKLCSSTSSSMLEGANDVGNEPSIAIGSDGFPVISHYDATNGDLRLLKCLNSGCTATSGLLLESANNVGSSSSLAIGGEGYPVIAHYDVTNGDLRLLRCLNISCTATSGVALETANNVGLNPSLVIGRGVSGDGDPLIAHYDKTNGDLRLLRCLNTTCTSTTSVTLESTNNVGYTPSIALDQDNLIVVLHKDITKNQQKIVFCVDGPCSVKSNQIVAMTDLVNYGTYNAGDAPKMVVMPTAYSDAFDPTVRKLSIMHYDVSNQVVDNSAYAYHKGYFDLASSTPIYYDYGGGFTYDPFPSVALAFDGGVYMAYADDFGEIRMVKDFVNTSNVPKFYATVLDDASYSKISTSDNIYDSAETNSTVAVYQAYVHHSNNTDTFTPKWEGQFGTSSVTVQLQVYDNSGNTWGVASSGISVTAGTDYTYTGSLTGSKYYDNDNNVLVRMYANKLSSIKSYSTDQFIVTFSSTPTLELYNGIFRKDDNGETNASAIVAVNATATNQFLGDRFRLRMTMRNTGSYDATGYKYQLEYSSSTCTTWVSVPNSSALTGQHFVSDYSTYVPDSASTTNAANVLTDPPSGTFASGRVQTSTTTTNLNIQAGTFTEYEYTLKSTTNAQAGVTYCFRLTNDGSTANFTYTAQPKVTLTSGRRTVTGGYGPEGSGSGAAHTGGTQGGGGGTQGGGSGSSHGGGGSGGGGGSE